jgi:hypothetical protein
MKNKTGALICCVFMLLGITNTWAQSYDAALEHWTRVLDRFVDGEGRIDFDGVRGERADLDEYLAFVIANAPENRPDLFPEPAAVIAYHVNTYNALAMHGVIEEEISNGFNSFFKRARFFKFHKVVIGGKTTSLYDYENDVIRPLGEERVHFALNCMVRDCPRLPREPFVAEFLDAQLDAAAHEFFSREKHLRIDNDKKTLWVSEILDFYTEDFVPSGKPRDLVGYVNRYLQDKVPQDYRVRFIPYDWTLNSQ